MTNRSTKYYQIKKFLSYYNPYLGLFFADMGCAFIQSATTLSSLDNESEKAIRNSLERLIKNRTTIVIAHRLSTIRNAQKILVLTNKGITEQGTHEELIALGGNYANLYNMQLKL